MTYWNAGTMEGSITDEFCLEVIKYHIENKIPLTFALIRDDVQIPEGAVIEHLIDMEHRGLIEITVGIK